MYKKVLYNVTNKEMVTMYSVESILLIFVFGAYAVSIFQKKTYVWESYNREVSASGIVGACLIVHYILLIILGMKR